MKQLFALNSNIKTIKFMKNKRLNNVCIVTLLALFFFPFIGCQQEELNDRNEDFSFLSLGENPDYSTLSKGEMKILRKAFQRLEIGIKDDHFYIKQTSGAEIHISEALFIYFKKALEKSNEMIDNPKIDLSLPRTRYYEEGGGSNRRSDCVACAVVSMLNRRGRSASLESVSAWIESQYGYDGVPDYAFTSVLDHYFYGGQIMVPANTNLFYDDIIAVMGTSDGGAHAFTLQAVNNGYFVGYDDQNGYSFMQPVTQLRFLYQVCGVK